MDHNIRIGLLVAWGIFILAVIIWWTRRGSSKHYAFSERATVILEAIRLGIDIGIIYWSKTEKRFLRRVVTPISLDGYSLRGLDHSTGAVRIFKVTRIRIIQLIPAGAPKHPPSRTAMISPVTLTAIGMGILGMSLLAFALFRAPGPPPLVNPIPSPLPSERVTAAIAPSKTDSNSLMISESGSEPSRPAQDSQPLAVDPSVKLTAKEPAPVDDFMNPPVLDKKTDTWYVVVESLKNYKINQVAGVMQAVFRYRADRAVELEQSVATLGQAVVWSGPKARAEKYRQLLEDYDLTVKIEKADDDSITTNATAVISNQPPTSTP